MKQGLGTHGQQRSCSIEKKKKDPRKSLQVLGRPLFETNDVLFLGRVVPLSGVSV